MELWKKRQHHNVARDTTRVMKLGNAQLLITIPAEIARWKKIGKGTLLKWSDAGQDRVLVEVKEETVSELAGY